MKNSKKTGFTVLIIVIAVSVILGALNILDNSSVLKNKPKQKHEIKKIFKNEKNGYIAKLDITGVIQDENRTYNQESECFVCNPILLCDCFIAPFSFKVFLHCGYAFFIC